MVEETKGETSRDLEEAFTWLASVAEVVAVVDITSEKMNEIKRLTSSADENFCPPNCEICATDLATVEEEEKLQKDNPIAYALACLLETLDHPETLAAERREEYAEYLSGQLPV